MYRTQNTVRIMSDLLALFLCLLCILHFQRADGQFFSRFGSRVNSNRRTEGSFNTNDPLADGEPSWISRSRPQPSEDYDDASRREKPTRLSYNRNHSYFVRTMTPEVSRSCSKKSIRKCHKKHGYMSCTCRKLRRQCYGEVALEDFDASHGSTTNCPDFEG